MNMSPEVWRRLIVASTNNPEFFATHVLRVSLRPWQREVLRDIRRQLHAGKTTIQLIARTCHGSGKTYLVAVLVLWFVVCHRESRTLTTGPSWASVENLLWPEIRRLYSGSLLDKFKVGRMLGTRFEASAAWYAVGAATDRPENLEGHHSPTAAMRIVDEAKAVPDNIFDSTAGMLDAPLNLDIWISTPSLEVGKFYMRDSAHGRGLPESTALIQRIVTIDDLIAQGIRTEDQKQEMLLNWGGAESEVFQARAMAQYIQNAEGALIPARWINAAFERTWIPDNAALPIMGYDVAGSIKGDQNALVSYYPPNLEGMSFLKLEDAWHQGDTELSVAKVHFWARERRAQMLRVDTAGLGKGPCDTLTRLGGENYTVQPYRSADPVSMWRVEDFVNRKAEDAFAMRKVFEEGKIALRCDERFRERWTMQLKAMKYKIMQNGKWQIIDPPDSPDMFDAALMAMSQRGLQDWADVRLGGGMTYATEYEAEAGPGDANAWS